MGLITIETPITTAYLDDAPFTTANTEMVNMLLAKNYILFEVGYLKRQRHSYQLRPLDKGKLKPTEAFARGIEAIYNGSNDDVIKTPIEGCYTCCIYYTLKKPFIVAPKAKRKFELDEIKKVNTPIKEVMSTYRDEEYNELTNDGWVLLVSAVEEPVVGRKRTHYSLGKL